MPQRPPNIPRVSLFDIFIGKGRTIRGNPGPPGFPLLETRYLLNQRPPKRDKTTSAGAQIVAVVESDEAAKDEKTTGDDSANDKPADANSKKADETKDEEPKANSNGSKRQNSSTKSQTKSSRTKNASKEEMPTGAIDAFVFTPEEDAELIKLKSENKSWKTIAKQMQLPQGLLKARFKQLEAAAAAADKSTSAVKSEEKRTSKRSSSRHHHTSRESNEPTKPGTKPNSVAPSKKSSRPPPPPPPPASTAFSSIFELKEDESFSFSDLQLLVDLLEADARRVWDRVASAFFDRTGRRILPGEVKAKMRGLR
ncbi:hypothetical protein AAFC00_005371 [Neodothiora populina]|uniref:Myb-like domain-containing protein n=1 Tax=Neodothiora populina TaxID=2781224 RepID=A0ABR3PKM5_9PEZI